jgi:hypothetical protein
MAIKVLLVIDGVFLFKTNVSTPVDLVVYARRGRVLSAEDGYRFVPDTRA